VSLTDGEWSKILGWPGFHHHEINEPAKTLKWRVRHNRGTWCAPVLDAVLIKSMSF
jgi:hypothetical protein